MGVTPATATQQPETYAVSDLDLTSWYSYRRIQDADARIKVVTERSTQRIVGATMLSSEAEQLINYLDFVIQNQLTPTDIDQAILAYPTLASDLTYFG